jgi:(R,R)-butanediol dehydrogenase/meso-butanediol dehydrogenase/diacetyl reductase
MKAAVYQGKGRFDVREIETPQPLAGQVLVRITRSAICGTDVHAFIYDLAPSGSVLGHEFAGEIAQLGPDVEGWSVGQRVVAGGGDPPPGRELPIRADPRYNYRTMGWGVSQSGGTRTGGFAEYTLVDAWRLMEIPEGVRDEVAALTEPCAVAVRAVRRSAVKLGASIAVIGAGPIGLLCLQAAQAAGATQVLVSEPAPGRMRLAAELGAAAVVNPLEEDVTSRFVELSGGGGADVIFDCAGLGDTLDQAFDSARRSGQVVLVAVPWEPLPLRPADWMGREVDFRVSFASDPEDWRIALDLLASGKISGDALMSDTSTIGLDDVQDAFEGLVKPSSQLQVVIRL